MIIESRGRPPYKISSGKELPKNHPRYSGAEQFSRAATFEKAFGIIFDLTNAGQESHGEYILDSEPKVVFTIENYNDRQLLHAADKEGLSNIFFK